MFILYAHINRQFDANKTCYPNEIRDFKKIAIDIVHVKS